ncbi:hypothetical protein GIB67_025220 [Kingdonia uniflora]|uniref:Uncharacterized protein n=1 Tax=Kingdonia uniflora TaxID=39325 RepID=A0A7J7N8A9_9MAGN|nr:hypothetical protein GIB67_025220 [Kingdonia uniflora]
MNCHCFGLLFTVGFISPKAVSSSYQRLLREAERRQLRSITENKLWLLLVYSTSGYKSYWVIVIVMEDVSLSTVLVV